jgi:hypothetical protein
MTHQQIADSLLAPIWRGIPESYKRKYLRNIWQQFEDNIRSAAYTSTLSGFLSKITTRLGVAINEQGVASVVDVTSSGEDKEILRMLRADATLLVLMVRVANEARRKVDAGTMSGDALLRNAES